ncbi:MAG: DUF1552 domain-containing protein [Planctomycetaceae bacterium]|nr:DUF1552 domain-containing protein [Planctomycetaceae bacterium]
MHYRQITRRTMLRGLGTTLALPWLETMDSAATHAANSAVASAPLRVAFLYVPNGMHMPAWTPTGEGHDFQLSPILSEIGFRDQMTVLSGLTLDGARPHGDGGGDHARGVAAFLTGAHPRKTDGANILNGPSVDQIAAEKIGHLTRLPSLELGTEASSQAGNCDSGYSCVYTSNLSWRTATSPVAKEMDPSLVFDRLFSQVTAPLTPEQRAQRDKHRRSILDLVQSDAKALHRALGANDRRKLDEYLYAVRDVEQRMLNADKLQNRDIDTADLSRPTGVPREYDQHVQLMLDMMVLAFQTDSTRIASFMYANAGSNRSYREIQVNDGHHDLSHHGKNPEKQSGIQKINSFHARLCNYFLRRLSAVREGDGTLLDHCLIVYGSAISDGDRHNHDDLPIVLLGGGCGTVTPGRHLRFPSETPLTNLYVSLLERLKIPVEKFSDSTGPLIGLK